MENFVQYWNSVAECTVPFMATCGDPLKATPPFFIFEASNVPWKPETEKTVTVNYTVENILLPRI